MHGVGKLLIIGTPLGNLEDLSPRARAALASCSLLLCEDTRHTGKLLSHFGISVRLESFHEHNENQKTEEAIERIRGGETVGLASDAGLPQLSDPGHPLVRRARELGLIVEPIPGPFAGALALVASGLPPQPFGFFGFAPHRRLERLEFYRAIAGHHMTALVYESPNRVVGSLQDARDVLGDVQATVAREMTKLHEEFIHGTLSDIIATLEERENIRGEITLVLAAAEEPKQELPPSDVLRGELERLRDEGLRRNDAVKVLAERYGIGRTRALQTAALARISHTVSSRGGGEWPGCRRAEAVHNIADRPLSASAAEMV